MEILVRHCVADVCAGNGGLSKDCEVLGKLGEMIGNLGRNCHYHPQADIEPAKDVASQLSVRFLPYGRGQNLTDLP